MRCALAVAALAITAAGCEPTYDDQVLALERLLSKAAIGSSRDYWLVKASSLAANDRVALIFGLGNDYAFCHDLAELYMQQYPADRYVCFPAN
jgi:hypothetical protein